MEIGSCGDDVPVTNQTSCMLDEVSGMDPALLRSYMHSGNLIAGLARLRPLESGAMIRKFERISHPSRTAKLQLRRDGRQNFVTHPYND